MAHPSYPYTRDSVTGLSSATALRPAHVWKVGDYAKSKSIYETKYRILEIKDGYMVAEIVAAPTSTRVHLDPKNVRPA